MSGKLFVISGPSGVGKDTVLCALLDEIEDKINLKYSISVTTRKPRSDEEDGVDYFFMSEDEFFTKKEKGKFLETACVHNNYYGTPQKYVENCLAEGYHVILELDIQGAMQIRDKFPEAILLFLIPPSFSELEHRLNKRNSEDKKNKSIRLKNAKKELKKKKYFDYQVVNDTIDYTVEKLKKIIVNEINKKEA